MDEDDRDSNASSEPEHDETMEDVDDVEAENDAEEDEAEPEPEAEEEEEEEGEQEELDASQDHDRPNKPTAAASANGANGAVKTPPTSAIDTTTIVDAPPLRSPSASLATPRFRPVVRPAALTARTYDIVPTMAAPQSTSVNCMTATPDMRFWVTGGSDGYIRKYDGAGTINGRQLLTVAQRHPFVDSVVKAGILMSYWENEEPPAAGVGSSSLGGHRGSIGGTGADDHNVSPVYSLAIHSEGLWLLSGLDSGGINLQSVRHDEGKRIYCLRGTADAPGHTQAVSVLSLAPDEKGVLSGSWDKNVLDWDLNNGQVTRRFTGSGGQISALEPQPASGAPIPAEAGLEAASETMHGDNDRPVVNGVFTNGLNSDGVGAADGMAGGGGGQADGQGSPAHESLFGSPAGSLFGDNDTMGGGGGGGFGGDDDDEFSRAMEMTLGDDSGQHEHSGDFTMADADTASAPSFDAASGPPSPVQSSSSEKPTVSEQNAAKGEPSASDGEAAMGNGSVTQHSIDFAQPGDGTAEDQAAETSATALNPGQPSDALGPSSSQPGMASSPAPQEPPAMVFGESAAPAHHDATQTSAWTFMAASHDGTIRLWDRRVQEPVARIVTRAPTPPWCMGACWSPDGNWIYAGRRNGTVEEFNIHRARSGWAPERTLKFPAGSGAVSCVRSMVNGRHLVCASNDILRLYDLRDQSQSKHSHVPFLIIPGPPRAGVISSLYIDPTSRFMLSTAGHRGWEGASTEVLIGYEINVPP